MALGIILVIVFLAAAIGPQLWVKQALARHKDERPDMPGTGAELARHLADHYGLPITVERTDHGDHYDPTEKVVRLTPDIHDGRSIAAVAVAAHEVGHALQDHLNDGGLSWRNRLVGIAQVTDKFAGVFFLASPFFGLIARTPAAFFGLVALGILFLGMRVLVHLVTLPVEFDASFNKALPILAEGGYLPEEDIPGAREVLKAAALTYVSAALMGLVNLARWVRILF